MEIKGRKIGSGVTLDSVLTAMSELRHRLRHRLIMFAAYGPGYGHPDPEQSTISMAPWTKDPVVPLESARPAAAGEAPAPKRRNTGSG